ncbi:flagellin [Leisingera sp.]|uniref:flagellin n=1 Tax=Leisingera sp. TaxID=1879318 RepID=UPI002B26CB91|nr:flagellin [Leisingera sp.]
MTSILTNNGAMVALQTLQSVNNNLTDTQNEISTGKKVANAQDNSSVWAISKVMESDVKGFEAISSSLSLGDSTVAVARNAAESIADALIEIKGKVIAAQEDNVDRDKLQEDIKALRDQISSISSAAQFNGLNLLSNIDDTAGSGTMSVLSSLDRAADGSVTATHIDVKKQDLGQGAEVFGTTGAGTVAATGGTSTPTTADDNDTISFAIAGAAAGESYRLDTTNLGGSGDIAYVARDGDTNADVATALATRITADLTAAGVTGVSVVANGASLDITNTTGAAIAMAGTFDTASDGTAGGGLADLANIDVSTAAGAVSALADIEGLIQSATDAAAAFGSSAGRIETQSDFVSKLTDSLKSGIGSMVDADMEAASARLKALQTQQQLAVQALSIANSAPQTLQQLFR